MNVLSRPNFASFFPPEGADYVHSANLQLQHSLLLQTQYTNTGQVNVLAAIKSYLDTLL